MIKCKKNNNDKNIIETIMIIILKKKKINRNLRECNSAFHLDTPGTKC